MPVDREKVAETMFPCESYSGWAAKYMRGDFDFRDLWNEVKGQEPNPEPDLSPDPPDGPQVPVPEGDSIEDPQNEYG